MPDPIAPHMPRPALAGDAGRFAELVQAAYAVWLPVMGRRPAPMDADFAAEIAAGQVYVLDADDDAEMLAGAVVLVDEPGALLVENVAVAPGMQGRGVGRMLMAFAEQEAVRRGYTAIRLYTNEKMAANVVLYARIGYVETHRAEQDGHRRVFMQKTLP